MYVIKRVAGSTTRIFPADRCVWNQADSNDDGGYVITGFRYVGENTTNSEVSTSGNVLTLGYIGKTGRFVPITDAFTATGTFSV